MAAKGSELNFHCRECGTRFEAVPARSEPVPDRDWQPLAYFAACPMCQAEAGQAAWELNLAKAYANATGPRTAAGKAAVTANLAGHPTPDEAKRTRFNAMKHGMFAQTAQYYPAKPGKYPNCDSCEYFNNGCDDDDHRAYRHKNPPACLKRAETFMQFQIAFETRDPKLLTGHAATLQALLWQMTNDMIRTVLATGLELRTPEWYYDKEGDLHIVKFTDSETGEEKVIHKVEAHPLLARIIELVNKNGMTLPDSGMTVKIQEDHEQIRGFLQQDAGAKIDEAEFREKQMKALDGLAALVKNSQERMKRDPVLIEHEALEREGGAS